MADVISIKAGAVQVQAQLNSTRTARALLRNPAGQGEGQHLGR